MVLDKDLLSEVQFLLVEPQTAGASWASGMWTPEEVDSYLNDAQQVLFTSTGIVLKRTTLPTTPNVLRQPLPQDWVASYSFAWKSAAGTWYPLERADVWELDALLPGWRSSSSPRPRYWTEADGQSLTVQVVPAPSDAGLLEVLYLAAPSDLGHAGAAITAPDDFAPGLVWHVVYRMLQKAGRATDPARAAIAKGLSEITTEAGKLMLSGRV